MTIPTQASIHTARAGRLSGEDVARLVQSAASGDRRGWDALVREFGGMVWAVSRTHRLCDADAADVAQATWLRLLEHLDTPADFMYFVDRCHQEGIGVLLDWTPAHFPSDAHGLGEFDGTHLYEHADPRQGRHPDWGTLVFNYGRTEVQIF